MSQVLVDDDSIIVYFSSETDVICLQMNCSCICTFASSSLLWYFSHLAFHKEIKMPFIIYYTLSTFTLIYFKQYMQYIVLLFQVWRYADAETYK